MELITNMLIWCVSLLFIFAVFIYLYKEPQTLRSMQADIISWVNRLAHRWLLKHDQKYLRKFISEEVVRRRDVAYAQGLSADELDRINIFSVGKSLGMKL